MTIASENLPDDIAALKQIIADLSRDAVVAQAEIAKLKFQLARYRRAEFGRSSEKLARDIAQLELAIEAVETDQAERLAAQPPAVAAMIEAAAEAQKPARRPLPEHLPREEVVHLAPCTCPSCGAALRKIGEDVTETLDYVPGRFKVIRHRREKLACRACDMVVQPPAPNHPIARGRAGAGLLAHIVVSKYDDHLPLYRQAEIYAREGVELETSTLSGWVGATAAALAPLTKLLVADVMASETLYGDDTPVPVLAPGSGRTKTGRLWTYVRDERPFGGARRPAAVFFYSRASTRGLTSSHSPVCCTPTAMRASTDCSRPGGSARRAAGPMSGASSLMSMRRSPRRSPKKRSIGSASSTPSRRQSTAHRQSNGSSSVNSNQSR